MKKFFVMLVSAIALFAFASCEKDETKDGNASIVVKTLDVTNVSLDGYTFNASFDCKSIPTFAEGGVFFSAKPNVSHDQNLYTTPTVNLKQGMINYSEAVNNYMAGGFVKNYYFKSGENLYYRAYAKYYKNSGGSEYIYGEEKSVVIK